MPSSDFEQRGPDGTPNWSAGMDQLPGRGVAGQGLGALRRRGHGGACGILGSACHAAA